MKMIKIQFQYDEYECDLCGHQDDVGAKVEIDGELLYNEPASASCFGYSRSEEDHYRKILNQLGYEVEENYD